MVKSSEIVDHGFLVSPTDVCVNDMIILDEDDARTGDNIGAKYIVMRSIQNNRPVDSEYNRRWERSR